MAEILLSSQPCTPASLYNYYGIETAHIRDIGGFGPPMLLPRRPYLVSTYPSGMDQIIITTLKHMPSDLTDMALEFGEDNTIAITEIAANLRQYGAVAAGAATGLYSQRMQGFLSAVKDYQDALLEYRAIAKTNTAMQAVAKQKVIAAFQRLQTGFQNELNRITYRISTRRGIALTNSKRAINIARSARNVARLDVADQVEAANLVNFAKYGEFLGGGLAVIDFASRAGEIQNSYKAGNNWERELFIESLSFAASVGIGAEIAGLGSAVTEVALGCFLCATPAGWVLIVVGLGVAAVSAGVSISIDHYVKKNGGTCYDKIMKWLN